jgi:hypothetical protein
MISLVIGMSLASAGYGQAWKKIIPLRSTRGDVEQVIGPPTESNGTSYDLKNERVMVFYTGVSCKPGWPYGWNVGPNVVTKIAVYPKIKLTLTDLGIDVTGYQKTQNIRLGGIDYTSKDTGISIGLKDNGQVDVIQVEPALKDYALLCPDAAARRREIDRGESAYIAPVVHFSQVTRQEEETRIDFFVDQVKSYPTNSKIYVFAYAGPKECDDEVTSRLARIRNRIASQLGVSPDLIATTNGGHKSASWTELFVVGPDEPRPLTTPEMGPGFVPQRNCNPSRRRKR